MFEPWGMWARPAVPTQRAAISLSWSPLIRSREDSVSESCEWMTYGELVWGETPPCRFQDPKSSCERELRATFLLFSNSSSSLPLTHSLLFSSLPPSFFLLLSLPLFFSLFLRQPPVTGWSGNPTTLSQQTESPERARRAPWLLTPKMKKKKAVLH